MLIRRLRAASVWTLVVALTTVAFVLPGGAAGARSIARSDLLRSGDLPFGWTVHRLHGIFDVGCLAPLARQPALQYSSRASITFVDNGNPPVLTEVVATSDSPSYTYRRVISALGRCHVVKGVFAGHRLVGSVHRMRFAHFGIASHAYGANASVEGALLFEDLVVVETSQAVLAVAEGNVGAVDSSQFEGFVSLALNRLNARVSAG
ncbi:MAG TPA: hypothetical protein VNF08_04055 [Acidimicrobiales bacterium]|nr:hypothetical protein [Acidimicrobiales bacterium]